MGYLEECQTQINQRDFAKFLELWEEYCTSDSVDLEEFRDLLNVIKNSEFSNSFGRIVESALPLWRKIPEGEESYGIFKQLIDLQTVNSPELYEIALEFLKNRYGNDPDFNERLRLVGMRSKDSFQGALSYYDLLAHMKKGSFVYHAAGWGTGEIIDISTIREQVTVEFENLSGKKHLTFDNAFKTIIPIADDHFLAKRFGQPDKLEEDAKKDPVTVVKLLLRDLGPKTAAEIKDELCDLVIPEKEWVKWWQLARSKIKKDTLVEVPETLREPFRLRKSELLHDERLLRAIKETDDTDELIQTAFNFVRDFPAILKNSELKTELQKKLQKLLSEEELTIGQQLQIRLFLESYLSQESDNSDIQALLEPPADILKIVDAIPIAVFKRRILAQVKETRSDWISIFISIFMSNQHGYIREYLLKELSQGPAFEELQVALETLLHAPQGNPDAFNWYFQLLLSKEGPQWPYGDKQGICLWFEAFLILFQYIEFKPEWRDLHKKMYLLLSGKRYAVVRRIIEDTSLDFINEFLLLVSKCQSLSDTDLKTLRSLAAVIHPSVGKPKPNKAVTLLDGNILWTTEDGLLRTQERIRIIGTTEIVSNAREIEAARALGDLRENSEYKFALEKRSRLQGELKTLSDQIHRSRVITKDDVDPRTVTIGSIVEVIDQKGDKTVITILGPWDADPDNNILSFQSKLVQAMLGSHAGDRFTFREEEYTIANLNTIYGTE
jgi:transcription elongation factor GreA-like protein/transcription elongation GreA/GreB family factor